MEGQWGRLVLVEDDEPFVRALAARVAGLVAEIDVRTSAKGPYGLPPEREAGVVMLSTDLLDPGSLGIVREVRRVDHRAVIIARARAPRGVDAVLLFEAGIDEYLRADDDLTLVEARVRRAVARRHACAHCAPARVARMPESDFDLPDEVAMTRIEERLWHLLLGAAGELVPSVTLMQSFRRHSDTEPKILYEHLSKLRARIADRGWSIRNARGKGYQLVRVGEDLAVARRSRS